MYNLYRLKFYMEATTSVSELRKNLSQYLETVKVEKKPLVFGSRQKREYLILPYPDGKESENLFAVYENLEDKIIQSQYYEGLEKNMADWNDDIHEDLFVSN